MITKEQKQEKRQKNSNAQGITLVALVVTIIVLIILAGVSISMLVGDNGIITQAQKAKENMQIATNEEQREIKNLEETLAESLEGIENEEKEIKLEDLKAGDYIKYNSGTNGEILCRVLYPIDSEYGVQIISDENVKEVALGVENDFETSKMAYNNAIETLNQEAEGYINPTYATDARCVGSIPTVEEGIFTNKNSETVGPTTLQFTYDGSTSIDCKGEDENYKIDEMQLEESNLITTGEIYWLASRLVSSYPSHCYFRQRLIMPDGTLNANDICYVNSGNISLAYLGQYGLRPCILLKDDIKIIGGDGTEPDKAYIIK